MGLDGRGLLGPLVAVEGFSGGCCHPFALLSLCILARIVKLRRVCLIRKLIRPSREMMWNGPSQHDIHLGFNPGRFLG